MRSEGAGWGLDGNFAAAESPHILIGSVSDPLHEAARSCWPDVEALGARTAGSARGLAREDKTTNAPHCARKGGRNTEIKLR